MEGSAEKSEDEGDDLFPVLPNKTQNEETNIVRQNNREVLNHQLTD